KIINTGWIQSAFDIDDNERTTFRTNVFENLEGGILSLVDGENGDQMTIRGDYVGGGSLAVDVDFDWANSDLLRLRRGTVTGETGIIVRFSNDAGFGEVGE